MKKIVALLLAMVITAALLAGGTAAYASVYTVTTPHITVDFDGGNTPARVTRSASGTNWEPGYASFRNIKMTSDDPFNWTLSFADGDNNEILPDVIDVYWADTDKIAGMTRSAAFAEMQYVGTLADFLGSTPKTIVGDCTTGSRTITVALKMRESAGNEYQEKTAQFSFTVTVSAKTGSN